jgi:hypothetical protein
MSLTPDVAWKIFKIAIKNRHNDRMKKLPLSEKRIIYDRTPEDVLSGNIGIDSDVVHKAIENAVRECGDLDISYDRERDWHIYIRDGLGRSEGTTLVYFDKNPLDHSMKSFGNLVHQIRMYHNPKRCTADVSKIVMAIRNLGFLQLPQTRGHFGFGQRCHINGGSVFKKFDYRRRRSEIVFQSNR